MPDRHRGELGKGWATLRLCPTYGAILVYKLPQVSREEIQAMLHLPDVDLRQTRFYQDVFAEGHQEGEQKGRQEGLQIGEVALVLDQISF